MFFFSGDVLKSRKVFASRFFFWNETFFLFDRIFSNFWTKHTIWRQKNPSLTKVLRKGSTLWAGLGWVWGGKRWDEVGVLWCSRFVVHPKKKRSWRFGRKMIFRISKRWFSGSKAVTLPGCMGLKCNFAISWWSLRFIVIVIESGYAFSM